MSAFESDQLCTAMQDLRHCYSEAVVDAVFGEYAAVLMRRRRSDWTGLGTHAGRFVEAAAKLVYEIDTGTPNSSKSVAAVAEHLQDNGKTHSLTGKDPDRLAKCLLAPYKLRSTRDLVHFADTNVPRALDAEAIVAMCRWLLSEILRLAWSDDPEALSAAVRSIAVRDIPSVGRYGGRLLLERTDCTQQQEIALLLYHAGRPVSRSDLSEWVTFSARNLSACLTRLAEKRIVVQLRNGNYQLTDYAGLKFVEEELADKLSMD